MDQITQDLLKNSNGISLEDICNGQTVSVQYDENLYNYEQFDAMNDPETFDFDISDNEDNLETISFERLAEEKGFENLTEDGKIKKLVRTKGSGPTPSFKAYLKVNYVSYIEYTRVPIDKIFSRKPYNLRLGTDGPVGFNKALASMQLHERSQFIIHYDYMYGRMGHPPRIPAKAHILMNIHLLSISESGLSLEYNKLTLEDRSSFEIGFTTAKALNERGKEHFQQRAKLAIIDYNKGLSLLDDIKTNTKNEMEEILKLKLKLLSNLSVCYNLENKPHKTIAVCKDIYKLVEDRALTIPTKVFYNHGKALFHISEYKEAITYLLKAQKREPFNPEVNKLLAVVAEKNSAYRKVEKDMANASLPHIAVPKKPKPVEEDPEAWYPDLAKITEEHFLKQLKNGEDEQVLSHGLMHKEIHLMEHVAKRLGMFSVFDKYTGKLHIYKNEEVYLQKPVNKRPPFQYESPF